MNGRYDLSESRLTQLTAAIDRYIDEQDVDVGFFACQTGVVDDHEPHRRIIATMRNHDRTVVHGWTSDPEKIAALFGNSSMVAGMRLHAGIIASSFQKPCVIFPYDTKVTEFAAQADLPMLHAEQLDSVETILSGLNSARAPRNADPAALWAAARLLD